MPGDLEHMAPGGGKVVQHPTSVHELRSDVDRVDRQLHQLDSQVSALREQQARMEGEFRHLVRAYERAAATATAQVMAELEIRKSGALATIKDRTAALRHRRAIVRELAFKGIALAMGAWAIVQTLLAARC